VGGSVVNVGLSGQTMVCWSRSPGLPPILEVNELADPGFDLSGWLRLILRMRVRAMTRTLLVRDPGLAKYVGQFLKPRRSLTGAAT
jgi:hypothetical protein